MPTKFSPTPTSDQSAGSAPVLNYTSQTTTYSAVINDYIKASSSSFTITLPDATTSGYSGKSIYIEHAGTSLTQVYTLQTTSSQTIGGVAGGSYALYTNGEFLEVISDGTNWQIVQHRAETDWVNAGATSISATTTPPTKGNSPTTDVIWWRREGRNVHVRIYFQNSTATGTANGTGDYKFGMPTNIAIDTSSAVKVSTTVVGAAFWKDGYVVGTCAGGDGSSSSTGVVVPYDANFVRFYYVNPSATGVASASFNPMGNASTFYTADFNVPVSGWQP